MSLPERSADMLIDLNMQIEQQLINHGISKQVADKISIDTCDQIRQTFGGEMFYMPKGKSIEAVFRQSAIYKDFNGHNHAELAKKYNCSLQHIYRVVKKAHQVEVDQRQGKLL